jgi:hypothetical protein
LALSYKHAAILLVGPALAALVGAGFPPIGERKYEIDGHDRGAPAQIKDARTASPKSYMKDPVQPGSVHAPAPTPRPKPVAVAKPKAKPGQLRFKAVRVNGHLIRPRVEFERDVLKVDRADEPVTQDFFNKIFEPAERDDF